MEIPDLIIPQSELEDFIKNKEYINFEKIFVTRLEETGNADPWTWSIFSKKEKKLLKSNRFEYKDNTSWPTYFIWVTIESTNQSPIFSETPTKHFLTMNNKQHYHRCYVIDRLNVRNILDKNIYSWTNKHIKHDGYKWIKPLNAKVIQKEYSPDELATQYNVPESEFLDTAFSLVLESQCNNNVTFFTEKTFIPMYHKRPVLILGNLNHWSNLKEYGFQDYPFIDYAFDKENDLVKRMDMYIDEVQRIIETYTPKEIHNMSKKICIYNYNIMFDIYKQGIGKPPWLIDNVKEVKVV